MAQEPIEGVGRTKQSAENEAMEVAARSNMPGAFTGDFNTGVAKAVGNNEMTLRDWAAHSILRSKESPEVTSPELDRLVDNAEFIENVARYSIGMLPQNRHLSGRKSDSVLKDNEEFYTSFGSAVKALAELYTNNKEKLGALISSGPNTVGPMPSEAQREQMRAIGQVASIGLSMPTRIPGDS